VGDVRTRLKFLGTGLCLPPKILSNVDLEKSVDTSDAWIRERTGIEQRRIAEPDVSTSDLCAPALRDACVDAGLELTALDAIIVATSTPDTLFPSTACWLQQRLDLRGMPAFDISAGCTGWLYALELAGSLIQSGRAKRIGVVAGEVMSKVINWSDRSTCVLFGDGAAAAIVGHCDEDAGILSSNWGADGMLAPILYQPAGGTQRPASADTVAGQLHTVHMEGNTVFKHAVRSMVASAQQCLTDGGLTPDDIDLLIPHQANIRIIEATRERVGVPVERVFNTVSRYGNVSAATIPIALHEAREAGRVANGATLLLTSFGTGLTWASMAVRW